MPQISDVRDLLVGRLNTWAAAQAPTAVRVEVEGAQFRPRDDETWVRFFLRVAAPSKPYAGTWYVSKEAGFLQVDVLGPERRLQKAYEKIAWSVREAFWPIDSEIAPTYGGSPGLLPLVRLGPTAPHVRDHPAPGDGRLGSIVTIDWNSDFARG